MNVTDSSFLDTSSQQVRTEKGACTLSPTDVMSRAGRQLAADGVRTFSTFVASSQDCGGAVRAASAVLSTVAFSRTTSSGDNGGAVCATGAGVTATSANFSQTVSRTGRGGAIYSAGAVSCSSCLFLSTRSGAPGGAVAAQTASITGSTFARTASDQQVRGASLVYFT